MYKVFIKDKQIVFTNNQHFVDENRHCLRLSFFLPESTSLLLNLLEHNQKLTTIVIVVHDVKEAFHQFKLKYTVIEAAGGVVKNNQNNTLFIYRLGKWDLPKGKIESGEEVEQAAIREVEEECAVNGLSITKPMANCYHMYHLKNELVLKKTHWFEMKTDFVGLLVPQLEEEIEKAEWLSNDQIKSIVLPNTYASIADFIGSW